MNHHTRGTHLNERKISNHSSACRFRDSCHFVADIFSQLRQRNRIIDVNFRLPIKKKSIEHKSGLREGNLCHLS